jgi:hypothetical protein
MSRDLITVATAELQAEYDAGVAKIRATRASLEPLHAELSKRSNAKVFVFNTVAAGQKTALLAVGVSPQAIAEAEKAIADAKAHKASRRAGQAVSS